MSMTYDKLREMGIEIDRGQLGDAGFDLEPGYRHLTEYQEAACDASAPATAARDKGEDLTHLNPVYRGRGKNLAARWMEKMSPEELSAEMSRRAKARDPRATTTRPWDKR